MSASNINNEKALFRLSLACIVQGQQGRMKWARCVLLAMLRSVQVLFKRKRIRPYASDMHGIQKLALHPRFAHSLIAHRRKHFASMVRARESGNVLSHWCFCRLQPKAKLWKKDGSHYFWTNVSIDMCGLSCVANQRRFSHFFLIDSETWQYLLGVYALLTHFFLCPSESIHAVASEGLQVGHCLIHLCDVWCWAHVRARGMRKVIRRMLQCKDT